MHIPQEPNKETPTCTTTTSQSKTGLSECAEMKCKYHELKLKLGENVERYLLSGHSADVRHNDFVDKTAET